MERILVPFDGSQSAVRALRHAAMLAKNNPAVQLQVLHVLDPVPLTSRTAMSQQEIEKMIEDEAHGVLLSAQQLLDQIGVKYELYWRAGIAGDEIAAHAREKACTSVIMGTRGLGRVAALVVGSAAASVIHQIDVPVTLIK